MSGGTAGCVKGCARKAHAKRPCGGQGMSAQPQIDSYAQQMAKLKHDWAKLTPDERRAAMQKAVDAAAKYSDFPAPKVKLDKTMRNGLDGQLDFPTWDIAINNTLASNNAITNDDFDELSNTIYHETRHGEQWYLIARRDAAEGLTAQQIMAQRGINNPAVAAAAKKHPLAKGAPRRACADAMFESVYGKGATSRNAVLNALGPNSAATAAALAKRNASVKAYNALVKNPASTAAQKLAAYNTYTADDAAYKAAKATEDANYVKYRALPEEADAWNSGDRAGKAVSQALKGKK